MSEFILDDDVNWEQIKTRFKSMDERDDELMAQQGNDFLARLGLDSDPFPAETDPSFYYENPDLMQRLDMIQHLIGFSNQMIFITGEEGIGKTSMLDRLEYYAPDHWRICRIQANPMLSTPVLLRQLSSGFELEIAADADDMFQVYSEALQSHIETLERAMLTPVLLIDNAHELPIDAFTMLFGFMQQEGGHSRMKMALFCEPQIINMLESPQLKTLSHNLTHQLEIPPFNEQQTHEYLEQRFAHAGLNGDLPFTSEVVYKIHKSSNGIPGKIHTLAQQALLDEDSQTDQSANIDDDQEALTLPIVDEVLDFEEEVEETFPATTTTRTKVEKPIGRKFQTWQIGAVAAVMALLAGVLWLTSQFKDQPESSIAEELPLDISPKESGAVVQESVLEDEPQLLEDPVVTTLTDEQPTELDLSTLAPSTEQQNPESLSNEIATQQEGQVTSIQSGEEVTDPLDEFVQALEAENHQHGEGEEDHQHSEVTVQIDENGNATFVEVPQKEPQPPVAGFIEKTTEEIAKTPVAQTLPAAVAPETTSASANSPAQSLVIAGVKGESWLRNQKDSHVMLQILGTHDQKALQQILNENALGADIAWFTTIHNGEPWYVVVKGPYQNRTAATTSIASLPAAIKKRKPWPRSVASVKKAMDEAQ